MRFINKNAPHDADIISKNALTTTQIESLVNVAHIITRLILGGAQENTLHNVEDQHTLHGDQVALITGPAEGPEGSLIPRAQAGGFRLDILDEMQRSIRPWNDWRAYRRMLSLLNDIKPDLIHTHSSKAGILGRYAARKLKIPVVHSIHGAAFHFGQPQLAYRAYVAAEKAVAGWTERYICVADAMRDAYLAEGISTAEKYVTIHSGFHVEPFLNPPQPREAVRARLSLEPQHIVVGKIGRLFHLKGHEFLIQAARSVIARNPQVRFLLVGDGILREEYEATIREQNLTNYFRFTGLVPPSEIPELMHAMDIVAHTSQWEGLARVLPQGLIAGKPVISYDVGGAREVVIPGETGYLLPRDSVQELSAAICELAENEKLRVRLGQTGRERFTDSFRHQTMTARIRDVYQQVLIEHR